MTDASWQSDETGGDRLPPPPGKPPDPNLAAVERAELTPEFADWLGQVAGQVDRRLDRVADTWQASPQADAARACAFGLLLGQLSALYPHAQDALHRTAEAHPSFTSLPSGNRLATLRDIAGDADRMGQWLGPLVGVNDRERVRRLLD